MGVREHLVREPNPSLLVGGNYKFDTRDAIRDIAIEGGEISWRQRLQLSSPSSVGYLYTQDAVDKIERPGASRHCASTCYWPSQQRSLACRSFADRAGDEFLEPGCRRLQFVSYVLHENFRCPRKSLILASKPVMSFAKQWC
jgi:hypothetical protein